jgi:hypothetical protein
VSLPSKHGFPEQISSDELHWIAGLLEGEGTFFPGSPSAPRYPVLALQMNDEDVVLRVATMFGRKPIRSRPRKSHWRPTFHVRITGTKAVAWMVAIHPLMGERRRAQIARAVASHDPKPQALLDEQSAGEALALLADGATVREVADRFGTSIWCIYDLRLGRTHRHLPRPVAPS